jgi:hypothetical protein
MSQLGSQIKTEQLPLPQETASPVGGCPCSRMYFPVGGRPCGRMYFPVGGCPCGRMYFPVGGCPCGRMCAVAQAVIRAQGRAPTKTRSHEGALPRRPADLLPTSIIYAGATFPCGRPPLRPNVCSSSGGHSRAGARSHEDPLQRRRAPTKTRRPLANLDHLCRRYLSPWEAAPAAECVQ